MNNIPETHQINNCKTLTTITRPFCAFYLTENSALIQGAAETSVIDTRTDKEIKRIFTSNNWANTIAVHPNRTLFAHSAHYSPHAHQKIIIYDATTYEPKHTIPHDNASVISLHFSPLDNTIAVSPGDRANPMLINYETETQEIINIKEADREKEDSAIHYPIIAFHPKRPLLNLT